MAKNNVRSFRFSDRVAEILAQQEGDSLNDKFERLVLRCHDEIPETKKKLRTLEAEIKKKRDDLQRLRDTYNQLLSSHGKLEQLNYQYERIAAVLVDVYQQVDNMVVTQENAAAAPIRKPVRK